LCARPCIPKGGFLSLGVQAFEPQAPGARALAARRKALRARPDHPKAHEKRPANGALAPCGPGFKQLAPGFPWRGPCARSGRTCRGTGRPGQKPLPSAFNRAQSSKAVTMAALLKAISASLARPIRVCKLAMCGRSASSWARSRCASATSTSVGISLGCSC